MRRTLVLPLLLVPVVTAGCGGGDDPTVLAAAVAECEELLAPEAIEDDPNSSADDAARAEYAENAEMYEVPADLGDEDTTLFIDGTPDGATQLGEQCLYSELEISDALQTLMGQTSSMMGSQEYDENGLRYRWTYHPDNGLDTVITIDEQDYGSAQR